MSHDASVCGAWRARRHGAALYGLVLLRCATICLAASRSAHSVQDARRGERPRPHAAGDHDDALVRRSWAGWLAAEHHARRHARTRAELAAFDANCAGTLGARWAEYDAAQAALRSVLVVDGRHDWPGLGTGFGFFNARQRLGLALGGRATFQLLCPCGFEPGTRPPPHPHDAHDGALAARCRADPAAHVHALGGWSWRWDAAAEARLRAAHSVNLTEFVLEYRCITRVPEGCVHAQLRTPGAGAMLLNKSGEAYGVAEETLAAMRRVMAPHAWVRLVPHNHEDLYELANRLLLPECLAPLEAPAVRRLCDHARHAYLKCEAFALWRPMRHTWAALQPTLQAMDGWRVTVAMGIRSGVADHVAAYPAALSDEPHASRSEWFSALSAFFQPCAAGTAKGAGFRNASLNPVPCVCWENRDSMLITPKELADACAKTGLRAAVVRNASSPSGVAGSLGGFLDCAANIAASLADSDATRHPGEHVASSMPVLDVSSGAEPTYRSQAWGVMLFSDAPALRCALEASELHANGHVASTPTVPGHVAYLSPQGRSGGEELASAVTRAAFIDLYALGLADVLVRVTGSVLFNAARLRMMLPELGPPGAVPDVGREHWFSAGREHLHDASGVEADTLALLARAPASACPAVARDVAWAREQYLATALT